MNELINTFVMVSAKGATWLLVCAPGCSDEDDGGISDNSGIAPSLLPPQTPDQGGGPPAGGGDSFFVSPTQSPAIADANGKVKRSPAFRFDAGADAR